jgi:hypothetical protein
MVALVAFSWFVWWWGRGRAQRGQVDECDGGHKPMGAWGRLASTVTLAHLDAGLPPASRPLEWRKSSLPLRASPFLRFSVVNVSDLSVPSIPRVQ